MTDSGADDRMRGGRIKAWLARVWPPARLIVADAAASLLAKPWHAIGMMSGILLAVASASAAVVIADTQQAQIDLRFDLQRSSHVVLRAESLPPEGFPTDQLGLVGALEPVQAVGEFSLWTTRATVSRSFESDASSAVVIAADPGGLDASQSTLVAGASPRLLDSARGLPLAWVGVRLATELGVAPADGDGQSDAQILVNGRPFSVAGILSNSAGFDYVDRAVVISRVSAVGLTTTEAPNERVLAHVRPGSAAAVAAYAVVSLDHAGALGLRNATPPDGERLLGEVADDLRRIGAALGGYVGLVGMIAIANTLMLSVNNRRRELGLRSAVGWSRRLIGALILTESAFAGLLASLFGAAAGLASAAGWCAVQGWDLVVWPALPWLGVSAGIAASLIGGLIPAWRAASVPPLTAMQL